MLVTLGRSADIRAAGGRARVRTPEVDILVFELDDGFHAIENLCSHAGVSMDCGRLRGHVLTCPSHLAQFDIRDGSVVRGPIEGDPENVRAQRVFPVHEDDDGVLHAEVPDDMDWRWFG